jgi:hypothetical protein
VALLFTDDAGGIVLFLRTFLLFYPPFSYTKVKLIIFRFSLILLFLVGSISILPKELGLQVQNLII